MKLSKNWVTANIEKDLEFHKRQLEDVTEKSQRAYLKGVIQGLEMALSQIEKAFKE